MADENHSKFIIDGEGIIVYKNENMQCKDCKYKQKAVAECKKYKTKPSYVFDGTETCKYYEKKRLFIF